MKNAVKYGVLLAIFSALWILIMHLLGFTPEKAKGSWIEFTSLIIPFLGLYLGIKSFKKQNNNSLDFFEGLVEGFQILIIGAVLSGAIGFLYTYNKSSELSTTDYMQRIFGALIIGVLANFASTLLLMSKSNQP